MRARRAPGCKPQGQGAMSPRRRPGRGLRMRGLHAAPGDSILRLGPRQDGKGRRGEGRSRQPFSLTVQNTQTRSRDAGSAWNGAPRPHPRRARPPRPRARTESREAPGPASGSAERNRAHAHPLNLLPSPSLPSIQLLAPEKRVVPALLATHRTTQASSLKKQDTRRRQPRLSPGIRPTLGASQAQG